MITVSNFLQFVISCYQNGVKYWYGTCWYPCTESLLASKAKQYPGSYTAARMSGYRKEIAEGAYCCDCVGLIKGAAWSDCGAHASKYGTNGCPDKSADGMLVYCKSKGQKTGSMNSMPDVPGLLLHKSGHVGVYIGNGYAIEAKGYAYDVVKSAVKGRGWTDWAYLPFVEYGEDAGSGTVVTEPVRKLGDRTLRKGTKGDDVKALQLALIALGYDCGKWGADGDYGSSTEAAVREFQLAYKLNVDGIFGAKSYAMLLKAQAGEAQPDAGEDGTPEEPPVCTLTITGLRDELEAIQKIYGGVLAEAGENT